jgi:hypothetical protein
MVLCLMVTACAAPDSAGVRDPALFRQVALQSTVDSPGPYTDVARCFEDQAALLPMTSFIPDEAAGRTTYRLRGFGYTFEEIEFARTATGSQATIFIAPNLNDRWHQDFERDRGATLNACAAAGP